MASLGQRLLPRAYRTPTASRPLDGEPENRSGTSRFGNKPSQVRCRAGAKPAASPCYREISHFSVKDFIVSAPPDSVSPTALRRTALHGMHRRLGAKMVDFGGWDMPVEYSGITAEHMAVRTAVGLFDVSHMGEIQFRGPGALEAVQSITMNDASRLKHGQAHYSALLTLEGTFVDDILVHRLGENDYLLVVNAGTTEKDYAWVRKQVGARPGIRLSDYSPYYSQLALQGPRALETLQKLTKVDLAAIKNYWFTWGQVAGIHNVLI